MKEQKVVIAHGFSHEEVYRLLKAVKREFEGTNDIAFAMTTEHSLTMRLGEVVQDVGEEHQYMKDHPPGESSQ